MRYEIGQKYAFVKVRFEAGENAFSRLYRPWADRLCQIDVKVLTCVEHHRVPQEWDSTHEKKCDGFIFRDENDKQWLNQYPAASYGQLDDSADGMVNMKSSDIGLEPTSDNIDQIMDQYYHYNDALRMINNITRAINPKSAFSYIGDDRVTERETLAEYRDQLISVVEAAMGQKIEIGPLAITKTDGTTDTLDSIQVASYKEAA